MRVRPTMQNDVSAAMAVIRSVDSNLADYMEESEWDIGSEEDITSDFKNYLYSFPGYESVVASTSWNHVVTFNMPHAECTMQKTGIVRDHFIAAVLIHEFKHTDAGGGHNEEFTPTLVMLAFAQQLGDEALINYIYGRLLAIDNNGQWSKVCPNCGKEYK